MYTFKSGKFYGNKEDYWQEMEQLRDDTGRLPINCFDFISVHAPMFIIGFNGTLEKHGGYKLISPMKIVELNGGKRPLFETYNYKTRSIAVKEAKKLGRKYECHIVYCN